MPSPPVVYMLVQSSLDKCCRDSAIGTSAQRVGDFILWILLPLRVFLTMLRMVLYRTNIHYRQFCLEEAEREWKWTNEHRPETEVWTYLFIIAKSLILWGLYYAVTPAKVIWAVPPIMYSLIMADKWRDLPKTGAFISFLVFWPLKYPWGTPLQWI
jgi:hypothetical protein